MSSPRPTIYDVARAAGVSKSLVSLVLRGADGVSPASRAAVEQAIRELGYRPSRAATALAAGRTKAVGVLIDDFANPWFIDLLRGLDSVLSAGGYRSSVVDSVTTADDPVDGLLSMRVDGIIVARDVPPALLDAGVPPFVVAGTRANIPPGVEAVANDDELGAWLATQHLLSLGHTSIGHLPVTSGAGRVRRDSFLETMRSAGARAIEAPRTGAATEAAGHLAALELLRRHPEITAIFAANDVVAMGALGAARELGLAVPRRLSIVGYDNSPLARSRLIDLTTVDDDNVGVGRQSARLLLARIAGEDPVGIQRTLTPTLVERGTTGPPAAGSQR